MSFLAGMEGGFDHSTSLHQPVIACTLIGLIVLQMIALGWSNVNAVAPDTLLCLNILVVQ